MPSPYDGSPNILSWTLFEARKGIIPSGDEILHFQFNPSEMTVDHEAEWEEKVVVNGFNTISFKSTKPKVFKFDMFLNDWGNHSKPGKTPPHRTVENQINWLEARMIPYKNKVGFLYSPPPLIFFWRDYYPVVLTSMNVKRVQFAPLGMINGSNRPSQSSGTSSRYIINTPSELFNDPDGKIARPALSTVGDRHPNDAIRATVSVTLKQFIYSTAPNEVKK